MYEGAVKVDAAPPAVSVGAQEGLPLDGWSDSPDGLSDTAASGDVAPSGFFDDNDSDDLSDGGEGLGADGNEANSENDAAEGEQSEREGTIPRQRFDALNAKYQETQRRLQEIEAWRPILDQAQTAYGEPAAFLSEIEKVKAQQQESHLYQRAIDVRTTLADSLYQHLSSQEFLGATGAVDIDPQVLTHLRPWLDELAIKLAEGDIAQEEYVRSEFSNRSRATVETLREQYPDMDESSVLLAIEAGRDPADIAKKTHERVTNLVTARMSQQRAPSPPAPPMPSATGSVPIARSPIPGTPEFEEWLQNSRRQRRRAP